MKNRLERINVFIFKEVSLFIKQSLRNPHINSCEFLITKVKTTKDLMFSTIYIYPLREESSKSILRHLNHASSLIGINIAPKSSWRRFPRLHFKIDSSFCSYNENGEINIDQLIPEQFKD